MGCVRLQLVLVMKNQTWFMLSRIKKQNLIRIAQILNFIPISKHTIMWNGKDEQGKELENGVYFYKLVLNGKTEETKKLILMK